MPANLNLIPGSGKEFRDKDYWENFFKVRGTKAFEWYGEYEHLFPILHTYIKLTDKILVIGCGNSKLSENMYDVGLKDIVNIDLSSVVIQQMSAKNKNRKDMKFLKMDMLNMEFEDGLFDAVIDKGTLDALMSDSSDKVDEDCNKLFNELDRVLKVGGKYMCVSLAQEHILDKLLQTFKEKGWIIRIHRLNEQDLDFHLPVFVFLFTKMKVKIPSTNPIIELKLDLNIDKFVRVSSVDDTKTRIKEYQNYGLTKFHITNKNVDAQDDVFVHLYDASNEKYPRYTIYIKDSNVKASKLNGIFAVFVVPIGKETEWLFGTKHGREELLTQAKYQRLAIAHLNRAHTYESLDAIISELSPKVMELAPKGIPSSYKIPLLSLGPEVDVREVRFKGFSDLSGEFYVEDVKSTDLSEPTRRLIFQSIIPTIQTEVILKEEPIKAKNNKNNSNSIKKPDYTAFMEDYFSMMLSFFYSIKLKSEDHLNILIIGLGGGVLAMYCKTWLKNCEIDAVEIDEKIVQVAQEYYNLKPDKKMRVHVDDGIKFINESAKQNKKWDIVIIDVNCQDVESELWAPTKDFIELDLLKNCKSILNEPNGLFVMNTICHNQEQKKSILNKLHSLWPHMYANKLSKGFNEILFCSNQSKENLLRKDPFVGNDSNNNFNKELKSGNSILLFEEVSNYLRELKI